MLKVFSPQALKYIFIFFAVWCFIAVLPLPIGYYTFLRFITTVGSLLAITLFYQHKNKILKYLFIIITIFFNPILPLYLQKKGIWIPLDILTGCAFLYVAFSMKIAKTALKTESNAPSSNAIKVRVRDMIITDKQIN
jgi:hypothetical protein